jgi:hypothetical protein
LHCSFCRAPFARLLLQGSFCKAPFARLLLQSPFSKATFCKAAFCKAPFAMLPLQGYILQGTFCKASFARLPFARLPFTRLPFAKHFEQTYEHIPAASTLSNKSRSRYMSNLIKCCFCHSKILSRDSELLLRMSTAKQILQSTAFDYKTFSKQSWALQKGPCNRNLAKGTLQKEPWKRNLTCLEIKIFINQKSCVYDQKSYFL